MWHDSSHPWPNRPPTTRRWLTQLVMRHVVGRVMPTCVPRPGRVVAAIESEEGSVMCDRCNRLFRDGDTAYEIGTWRIKVAGKTVRTFNVDIYVCAQCARLEGEEEEHQ